MDSFTEKLFETFRRLGIEGENVENTFWNCIHSKQDGFTQSYYTEPGNSQKSFTMPYHKNFGKDLLRCDLHIEWDEFFQAYKMNSYTASVGKVVAVDSFNAAGPFGTKLQAAYLRLSGKASALCQTLREIGLLTTGTEVLDITGMINSDLGTWGWEIHRVKDKANISYSVPITLTENWDVVLGNITASYSANPPIPHGVFNGIDSAQLDVQMQKLNWFKSELLDLGEFDQLIFTDEFNKVFSALEAMEKDRGGATIATMLKEKYWTEHSFMFDYFTPSERKYISAQFPSYTHSEEIFKRMQDKFQEKIANATKKNEHLASTKKVERDKPIRKKGRRM